MRRRRAKSKDPVTTKAKVIAPEPVATTPRAETAAKLKPLTPIGHAKRILAYGDNRAYSLLRLARMRSEWKHVDWDYVESKLPIRGQLRG